MAGRWSRATGACRSGSRLPPADSVPRARQPILHNGAGHLMTIAPTGSGKGVGAIIPALLRHRGPVIVIDPKGENYAVTAAHRRKLGHEVVLLDPFGVTGEEGGGLNPVDLLDKDDPCMVDDAAMLAELLVPSGDGTAMNSDPFWSNRARQVVHAILLGLVMHRPPVLRNVEELYYLLHQNEQDLEFTMREFRNSPLRALADGASVLELKNDGKVQSSYLSVAQDHLAGLGDRDLSTSLGRSTFDLGAVTRGDPLSIYIVMPPDRLQSHRRLLRLWIGCLFSLVLRRRTRIDPPTLFLLDEAAQLGPLPQFRQALTLLRGYGLQCWSFWQDLSQLQRLYPRDWSTLYNNCAVHQVFGITNMGMARSIARLNRTHDAQLLLELEPDEMELSLAGMLPVIAQRPNYLSDPPFLGQFRPNPFFEGGRHAADPADHPARIYDSQVRELHPTREELAEEIEQAWELGDLTPLGEDTLRRILPDEHVHNATLSDGQRAEDCE
ncbi:MAG: type IV secretory system conjugative DNA transfer family protein [Luteimonas sp.]|nr:type IV secretory system conjugative DNA transfer family protein [Luteimonas sp.]